MTSDTFIIDSLTQSERARGATRMFIEGTDPNKVTPESAKLVIHHVEIHLKEHSLTRKQVARDVGYSPGVVSEVMSGTYRGDWQSVILDLDRWLDQRVKQIAAPQSAPFIWTEVAREIETVAHLVIKLHTIGLVYGPDTSGIGKTMALQAIHAETPGSIFITCDKIESNPTGLLRAIGHELRLSEGRNTNLYARIRDCLRGTSRLLIIDQIHNLRKSKDDKPLYILADLQDATKAPQLWCGTADMVAYLQKGRRGDESLAQIRSRITYVRDLLQRCKDSRDGGRGEPLVTVQQIRQMFASNKVRLTEGAIRFLYEMASVPDSGALRTCRNLVLIATLVAQERKMQEIDVPLLLAALRDSVQADTFSHLVNQVHIERHEKRAVG